MNIAILVSSKYSKETPNLDDIALLNEFAKNNITAEIVVWNDPTINYKNFDYAIIRSCWDYDENVYEFLEKMKEIEKNCTLINNYQIVYKNHDKKYLLELEQKGINIIPTVVCDGTDMPKIPKNWRNIIVKPTISASGKNTFKINRKNNQKLNETINTIFELGKVPMLQKYLKSIESTGERSIIVIDGKICCTVKKTPKKGNFLVHINQGGKREKVYAKEDEIDFITNLLDKLYEKPAYMRVDFLRDDDNTICLLELEMIEPHLYMAKNPKTAEMLVKYVIKLDKNLVK